MSEPGLSLCERLFRIAFARVLNTMNELVWPLQKSLVLRLKLELAIMLLNIAMAVAEATLRRSILVISGLPYFKKCTALEPHHMSWLNAPLHCAEGGHSPATFQPASKSSFMKLEDIAVEPADGHKIWWPLDKTFRSVDFIRQPNEVCQVTLNPKHKNLDLNRIMECFEVWPPCFVQCR